MTCESSTQNDNKNREVLDKIKSLEETDKELNDKITDLTISMNRLAVSSELMQEAIVKLSEVKEQMNNFYSSVMTQITTHTIRIERLETGYSFMKYLATGLTTAVITSGVAYLFTK